MYPVAEQSSSEKDQQHAREVEELVHADSLADHKYGVAQYQRGQRPDDHTGMVPVVSVANVGARKSTISSPSLKTMMNENETRCKIVPRVTITFTRFSSQSDE